MGYLLIDVIVNVKGEILMPKTKEQCNKIKEKRRMDIIKTATTMFAFEKYENITTDRITDELKCSHGLFYHYFRNKEDLFEAVLENSLIVGKDYTDAKREDGETAIQYLGKLVQNSIDILCKKDNYIVSCLYLILNIRLQLDNIPQTASNIRYGQLVDAKLKGIIEEGQKEGSMFEGDIEKYAICIIAIFKGLLYNRLLVGASRFVCPDKQMIMNVVEVR